MTSVVTIPAGVILNTVPRPELPPPLGVVLAGLAIAPVLSCQYALVGQAVSEGRETEAFTWLQAALVGGLSVGSALAGLVIGPGGVGAPFGISCAAFAVAAVIAARLSRQVGTVA